MPRLTPEERAAWEAVANDAALRSSTITTPDVMREAAQRANLAITVLLAADAGAGEICVTCVGSGESGPDQVCAVCHGTGGVPATSPASGQLTPGELRDYLLRAHGMALGNFVQDDTTMRVRIGKLLEQAVSEDTIMSGTLGRGGPEAGRDILTGTVNLEPVTPADRDAELDRLLERLFLFAFRLGRDSEYRITATNAAVTKAAIERRDDVLAHLRRLVEEARGEVAQVAAGYLNEIGARAGGWDDERVGFLAAYRAANIERYARECAGKMERHIPRRAPEEAEHE